MDTQTNTPTEEQTSAGQASQANGYAGQTETKFCKHCGGKIPKDAVVCTLCGRQVESFAGADGSPNIVINNSNQSTNTNVNTNKNVNSNPLAGRPRNKWVAFFLCLFLGMVGAHKFYEGKIGMGILYFFTFGLCFIGWIIDLIAILGKPNPYYV